jgi:hypothetical protein
VSATCREALAAVADAGGETALAAALRTKSFETTRKRDLMHMARAWGYRSRVWQMKASCKRKRARDGADGGGGCGDGRGSAASPPLSLALAQLSPPLPPLLPPPSRTDEERLRCVLLTEVRPLGVRCVAYARGHSTRDALRRCGSSDVFVTPWSVQYNCAAAAFVRAAMLPRAEAETLTLRAWQLQTASLGEGAASAPAWASLAGREAPPDRVLRQAAAFQSRSVDTQARLRQVMRAVALAPPPPGDCGQSSFDVAETNLDELQHTTDAALEFIARARALVASAALLGFGAYCALAIEVVDEVATLLLGVGDACRERADWMSAFLAAAPRPALPLPPPSFSDHMADVTAV